MRALLASLLLTTPYQAIVHAAPADAPVAHSVSIAEHVAQVGDQRVRYLESGTGDTLVLLVHGWPQTADEWRRVMPLLGNGYRVVAPDLRGIGGSRSPSRDYSKAALARDLHAFVETLGARRVVVVGHDIGGMVAYAYARLFPQQTTGVAILDVPLPGLAPWNMVAASPQAWHFDFNKQHPLAETLIAGRQRLYYRYFIDQKATNSKAVSDREVERYARAYASADQLAAGLGLYRTFDQDAAFNISHQGAMTVPMLLAGADGSMGQGIRPMAEALRASGVREVEPAIIERSGHWVAEEQPTSIARLIKQFVTRLP